MGLYPEAEPPFLPQTAPGHAGVGLGAPLAMLVLGLEPPSPLPGLLVHF